MFLRQFSCLFSNWISKIEATEFLEPDIKNLSNFLNFKNKLHVVGAANVKNKFSIQPKYLLFL
jgi:hypothetical protein